MTRISVRRSRGFGYLDVVVAVGIILLVVAFLLPTMSRTHGHSATRVKCASNLRQIGQAMLLYANENRQAWPRVRHDESAGARFYTGVDDTNPFDGTNDPMPNDVTAALFLLVRTQDIGTEVFTCPNATAEKYTPKDGVQNHGNFPGKQNLSYSIAMPYAPKSAVEKGYRWNSNVGPEFAIMSDMSPGGDASKLTSKASQNQLKPFNSEHHERDGQNVLFGDGHVEFSSTPFCGKDRDFIYAPSGGLDSEKNAIVLAPGTAP